ncbi:hypothetical protein CERZMDRAFT_89593 [Cercospora zeae-maydis SCOH1-5]|uniref:Uncharacterized protein n=1 Tax=Cercospora zeae-maydis SCOH1-5 TaxID=717836 RepID=A0A6A6FW55_9PEZI|nr:hypothetical protein CERZMDRAFT_89593 [Cercospora zeae-maydis SCOH1-5]
MARMRPEFFPPRGTKSYHKPHFYKSWAKSAKPGANQLQEVATSAQKTCSVRLAWAAEVSCAMRQDSRCQSHGQIETDGHTRQRAKV